MIRHSSLHFDFIFTALPCFAPYLTDALVDVHYFIIVKQTKNYILMLILLKINILMNDSKSISISVVVVRTVNTYVWLWKHTSQGACNKVFNAI